MFSSFINTLKTEYDAIRIRPQILPADMDPEVRSAPHSAYHEHSQNSPLKSSSFGRNRAFNLRISHRTSLGENIALHGWPSRGGIIVLENATPPDFDYLHLNPLDPPLRRDTNQAAEDAFCQSLLRLGAIWWDSEARYDLVRRVESNDEECLDAIEADESLRPSRRERGWVRVAWSSHTPESFCVLECEKPIMGRYGDERLRPKHYGIISLARTMDERFMVLQRLGGVVYAGIAEYRGSTFLGAWEEDHQGEKGPLVHYKFLDPSLYDGHPDDALGTFSTSGPAFSLGVV